MTDRNELAARMIKGITSTANPYRTDNGRPTSRHTVVLHSDAALQLKLLALQEKTDMSALIRQAVDDFLAAREPVEGGDSGTAH